MSNRRPPGKDLVPSDGNVPVSPKRDNEIADFKVLKKRFDAQVTLFRELCFGWQRRNYRVDLYREGDDVDDVRNLWTRTREGAEQCVADVNRLWGTNIHHPPRSYLVYRIGKMLKRMPDVKLSNPKDWANCLAERLEAEDLNVMVIESVFREIEDELGKPPKFSDVLPLLKDYKTSWQRRLAAIDLDRIRQMGEEMVFTLEFKRAVFKEAVLEYVNVHGYVDLATSVREDVWPLWRDAIEATARTEGLSELAAKMEAGISSIDDFEAAKRILTNKKNVTLEWDLLLKNAQRRVHHDKQFVCQKCAAGYEERLMHCMSCGDDHTLIDHASWEQQIAQEIEKLQDKLQRERQWLQFDLQWKRECEVEEARLRALFAPFRQLGIKRVSARKSVFPSTLIPR